MRVTTGLALVAGMLVLFNGRAEAGKTCLASATEALQRINGLVIKKSRTRPVSPTVLATWKGQSKPIMLDVDIEMEGDAQTFSYMCVVTQGSAFVQRTMY
jgi:hypothetical protein